MRKRRRSPLQTITFVSDQMTVRFGHAYLPDLPVEVLDEATGEFIAIGHIRRHYYGYLWRLTGADWSDISRDTEREAALELGREARAARLAAVA